MAKNKHIYFVHLLNDNSGSPRVLSDAISSLDHTEYEKTVLTSCHEGFLSNVQARKVNIRYFVFSNRYLKLFSYLVSQLSTFIVLSYYLICNKLKGEDSIVLVNTLLPFGAGLSSKLFSNNTIYYIHETMINPLLLKRFLLFVVDKCADSVLFVSNYVLENSAINSPTKKMLYNGLRRDFILSNGLDLDLGSKFKNRTVLFVGSLKIYKGIDQFLAVSFLLPHFKFIAAVNCSKEELRIYLKSRVLPTNFEFMIKPHNLIEIYKQSSLVMNCSIPDDCIETFGLSLLEAMAFGCPVIGPPVGGPVEIVNSNVGCLIDSRNLSEIVGFISLLHNDFGLWRQYSDNAIEHSKLFTSKIYQDRFALFIQDEFYSLV
ncbi:glycosyltransferase family 4 protein [Shewanella sp. S1-49-MNA-CIBAN-0167]|uniref:glycosyltransferase family 4 protein n=1 Tax=Shewanella sp. S1-49-MNA-CIBAN-0167 TaxID=3140468 RepID=UPI003332EC19